MSICIVRETVRQLRLDANRVIALHAETEEQKSKLLRLVSLCDTALSRVSKSGRLDTNHAQPPFRWLENNPEIDELLKSIEE